MMQNKRGTLRDREVSAKKKNERKYVCTILFASVLDSWLVWVKKWSCLLCPVFVRPILPLPYLVHQPTISLGPPLVLNSNTFILDLKTLQGKDGCIIIITKDQCIENLRWSRWQISGFFCFSWIFFFFFFFFFISQQTCTNYCSRNYWSEINCWSWELWRCGEI